MKPTLYLKAIYGALVAGLGAAQIAWINDEVITTYEYISIAAAVVGAFGVIWGIPNDKLPPPQG